MRSINIDFNNVTEQLSDLATTIKDTIQEVTSDTGFWAKVSNFVKDLFQSIANLFG